MFHSAKPEHMSFDLRRGRSTGRRRGADACHAGAYDHAVAQRSQGGWAALERGAWSEAREAFEDELARDESPELLEGYSWALWWLNLGDPALAARERAYNAYRQSGDARGAARVATWLASDVIDFRCDTAVSNGWLRRAHRLLDGVQLSAEHGWLALHEGTLALDLAGDTVAAARLGTRCADIGSALGDVDLEMLGSALCGLAAVHEGAVREGLGRLDEAATAAIAGELQHYVSVGWSCCSLIKACEEVRDYERAAQWSEQMIAFAHRLGFEPWVRICRSFHAWVLVCRGNWDEADRQLIAARDRLAATRPPWTMEAVVRLGELRRRQGRLDEAADLFEASEPHPRAAVGLGYVALDRDDVPTALTAARRAVRSAPGPIDQARTDRLAALELLVCSLAAAGEAEEAAVALQQLENAASVVGTPPVLASVAFHTGLVSSAAGNTDRARTSFEDARDRFLRCQAPYDLAVTRIELSRALIALGEPAAAEREATAALRKLQELGATLAAERAQAVLGAIAVAARARATRKGGSAALTDREREVLALIARGLSDREVAAALVLSEHTVHRHVSNILRKLGVPSRTAAVAQATRQAIL